MNIIATAVVLLTTLLAVPLFSWFFGTPLGTTEMAALETVVYMMLGVALLCFVVGELTNNVSQVDKVWSLVPIAYVWTVTDYGDYAPRLVIMAVLVTLWGARLTYNFSRHGAYQLKFWGGHEDYRWEILRQRPEFQKRWVWSLFNFGFICTYQNTVILLFTLPTIVVLQNPDTPLGLWDYVLAGLLFGLIVFETIADNQQWSYQTAKYAKINAGEALEGDYKKGFLDKGLWALCRHPNYFAEQSIWVCFYFFSVIASGEWFNWSIAGCLLLVVLFRSSSSFSEEVSAEKYSLYTNYQKTVPRFFPKFW